MASAILTWGWIAGSCSAAGLSSPALTIATAPSAAPAGPARPPTGAPAAKPAPLATAARPTVRRPTATVTAVPVPNAHRSVNDDRRLHPSRRPAAHANQERAELRPPQPVVR